nr:hypothetical protein Iba_chr04bCG10430 [Ipomoea batatas]
MRVSNKRIDWPVCVSLVQFPFEFIVRQVQSAQAAHFSYLRWNLPREIIMRQIKCFKLGESSNRGWNFSTEVPKVSYIIWEITFKRIIVKHQPCESWKITKSCRNGTRKAIISHPPKGDGDFSGELVSIEIDELQAGTVANLYGDLAGEVILIEKDNLKIPKHSNLPGNFPMKIVMKQRQSLEIGSSPGNTTKLSEARNVGNLRWQRTFQQILLQIQILKLGESPKLRRNQTTEAIVSYSEDLEIGKQPKLEWNGANKLIREQKQ